MKIREKRPWRLPPVNKALIDTDIFFELGKDVNQTIVGNGATYRAAFGRYTISVITIMEIVRGFQKKLCSILLA
jgi:hypothetical protein